MGTSGKASHMWWWRWKTEDQALWKQVIQAIHGQLDGGAVKKGTWANITKLDEELQQLNIPFKSFFSRKIGKGDSVFFWTNEWIGDLNLANMFSRLYALEIDKDCSLSERLIRVGETFTWSWNWRRALRSGRERADFDQLMEVVRDVILSNVSDSWRWSLEKSDMNCGEGFLCVNTISSGCDGSFDCSYHRLDEGSLGMSHQQALAQITSQASQVHTQSHSQLPQNYSFNSNATTYQRLPPSIPNHNTAKESSNLSNSDNRYQPPSIAVDKPADDGYNWRKYGQKQVKGSEYPRSYYKCTHPNCPVKKQVERSVEGLVTEIIYKGQHNHQPPQSKRGKDSNTGTSSQYEQGFEGQTSNFCHSRDGRSMHSLTMKDQESSQATYENSGSSDGEEVGDDVSRGDERHGDEPQAKRRNTEVRGSDPVSSHRTVTEPRIIVQTTSEVDLLDDGYRWRKYGQKVVKGNPHPRSYYKCTFQGCNVRKHVERAASDPKAVITTYEGKHTHDVPAAKNSSHNLAATASLLQPPNQAPAGVHSLTRRPEYPNRQQPPQAGRLQFKEEQIT
ncbi:DNA-binding WRKY [Artemisia annua]|uniref:DNA-binding WRKY n=1 Tax=Artemisia annua TaxID=35608 RepID=A0A2U1KWP1_ARTAN|nr:DNA-binding WRKY [Artemisia annua]